MGYKEKTVVTITSSSSDLVRLAGFLENLDENFNHVFIHDKIDDQGAIEKLNMREPDHRLDYAVDQQGVELIKLLKGKKINPSMILLLGDSDFTTASVTLKKQGYTVTHVGAGQRSTNRNTPKEINRVVCDHCSDYYFVYNKEHALNLTREKLPKERIFTIGNTIEKEIKNIHSAVIRNKTPVWYNKHVVLDINLPENTGSKGRLSNILAYANNAAMQFEVPIHMIEHENTLGCIRNFHLALGIIEPIKIDSYVQYIEMLAKSIFLISDRPESQEESCLLNTPTIVPRNELENPLSVQHDCCFMLDANTMFNASWKKSLDFVEKSKPDASWLNGEEAENNLVDSLKIIFN